MYPYTNLGNEWLMAGKASSDRNSFDGLSITCVYIPHMKMNSKMTCWLSDGKDITEIQYT